MQYRYALLASALLALALTLLVLLRSPSESERPAPLDVKAVAGVRSLTVELNASGRVRIAVRPLDPPSGYPKPPSEGERVVELECGGRCTAIVEVAGGRGYSVTVEAGEGRATITVPYVREFEDLASRLWERGVVVSAAYMPWRMGEVLGSDWRGDQPLLGLYDASDDYAQWRHIDLARGYGVHVFWVDWTMYASTEAGERIFQVTRGLLEKGMVVGIMIGPQVNMRWGSGYPSIDLGDQLNARILLDLVRRALPLMKHPNYYRVEGRPAILVWNEAAFYNRRDAYRALRELVKGELGVEPYLIADALPRIQRGEKLVPGTPGGRWYIDNLLLRGDGADAYVDAYTSWIGFYSVQGQRALSPSELAEYQSLYREHLHSWWSFSKTRGKCLIPTVSPGFDRTHDAGFGQPWPIPRDPTRFASMLEAALQVAAECGEVRIDTWNDFFEGSYIEPSVREGFLFLEALASALSRACSSLGE
ncbi:MAG: glycoside hydrolase family 99-like domain-containing protein [Thermofilaceae archaeon]